MTTRFVGVRPGWSPAGPATMAEKMLALEERNRQLEKAISQLQEAQLQYGTLVKVSADRCAVKAGPQVVDVPRPDLDGLAPGAVVLISQEGKICAIVDEPPMGGNVFLVERMVKAGAVEVSGGSLAGKAVLATRLKSLAPGDHVLATNDGAAIVHKLPRSSAKMEYAEPTNVRWEDIGGCVEAKRALREAVVDPYVHAEVYRRHGHKPPKGILLHGPPGNGKTMLGKAAATALAELHGRESGGFLYVKGPEILNKFVGQSEAGVREIFADARRHCKEHGFPPIVFIDEADAIFGKRGGAHQVEGMERTIVPQFLAEMDGLDESSALLILATNRPDALDPAVVRDGRCDRRVHVGRPTEEEAREILAMLFARKRLVEGLTPQALAGHAAAQIWSGAGALFMLRSKSGKDRRLGLRDLVSGAIVAGIASRAVAAAVRREVETGQPQSVGLGDVDAAVDEALAEMRHVDNQDMLIEAARAMGDDLVRVEPA